VSDDNSENIPSELDEATHKELADLYNEATRNLLFAKAQQWRTVVYTTFVFAAIVAVKILRPEDEKLGIFLLGGIFVIGLGAILLLVMYQVWQVGELRRLNFVSQHLSSFFRAARNLRSPLVGEIHRYSILFGLMLFIILAAVITLRILWASALS